MKPVALVTGARRGIGLGIAKALASKGFDLAITDIVDDTASQSAIKALEKLGAKAVFIQSDIADLLNQGPTVEAAIAKFGHIDCLVNNAGIGSKVRGDFLDLEPANYNAIFDINLRGTVFFTQALLKVMLAQKPTSRPRSIINITSVSAGMTSPERLDYCMTKAALAAFTQGLALRLADQGISVFDVRPGIIRSDMTAVAAAKYDKLIAEGLVPMKRWGEPEDLGRIVAALASGDFNFATGSVINADGALSISRL
ncbi:NAD(P)-dependent dehydrogenase (short-subunit alcohol dehydrogenase family) [Phyllobacterium trifolii]|uniref:NAD(P)-dependent dehydrogenase (Short-subunit alcohol dehydrogenase family) n=1 Tax=Phyllobacterium trifolii TaxID=300193 RepID=A0A839UGD4_9HYPH|nr:3-ketoacyl-ACP reductase [Phyllobacterium trifolii]MBB3148874.1 NAD(P)-dependent dehydrogenase (short-subunit alcohol dehydrogenase family) [Phyllobacterium trifolii]